MEWLRDVHGIKKAAEWWWAMTKLDNVINKNRGYKQLTSTESYELTEKNRLCVPKSPIKKRASTARPVVIVESENEMFSWVKYDNNNFMTGPVVNMNDRYIEVYYTTDSEFSYPGKLERYKKNVCYCCDQCTACQMERKSNLHRPLHQVSRRRHGKC